MSGNEDTVGASVSWLASNGLNVTLAAGAAEDDNPAVARKKFGYAKVGYIVGKHAVSVDYGRGDDFALAGDKADTFGIGYVYTPQTWLELYAGAKQHRLDRPSSDFDNVTFFMVGSRLKF